MDALDRDLDAYNREMFILAMRQTSEESGYLPDDLPDEYRQRIMRDPVLFMELLTQELNRRQRQRPLVPGQQSPTTGTTRRWDAAISTPPHADQLVPFYRSRNRAISQVVGMDLSNGEDHTVFTILVRDEVPNNAYDGPTDSARVAMRRIQIDPQAIPEFLIDAIGEGYMPSPIELAQWKLKADHYHKISPSLLPSGEKNKSTGYAFTDAEEAGTRQDRRIERRREASAKREEMLRQIWSKMDIRTCDRLKQLEVDAKNGLDLDIYFAARHDILSQDSFIQFAWNMAAEENSNEKKV